LALIILLGLSLQVGKGGLFKSNYDVVAFFKESQGIDPGTKVTLRGVPIGSVRAMDWDPKEFKVRMVLQIEDRYRIPSNATAKIQVSSLLGGSVVNVSVEKGPEQTSFLKQGDRIDARDTPGIDEILTTVAELSGDTQSLIRNLDKNQAETMAKINAVVDENREYFRQTSESFAKTGPKLEVLSERLNEFTANVMAGEGTLGRLYKDPGLYDELKAVSNKASEIVDQVKSGEGTVGSLIYDDAVVKDMRKIMEDLQRAGREIELAVGENREGLRSLVNALSGAGPKIEQAINNMNEVSRKINAGEGTIGKLVNDPALYDDTKRAISQVGESFETGEEQGVFRSFLGLLFGALI
jgi:phospholipid/cholesterol/gamma-HCH transport system substrate-binding protein